MQTPSILPATAASSSDIRSQIYQLVARPDGMPTGREFQRVEQPMPAPGAGELLVANRWLSVDPYMRECMDGDWALHAPLEGRALGQVLSSQARDFQPGQWVFHRQGWRSHALLRAGEAQPMPLLAPQARPARSELSPPSFLGLLGGTGLSAYVALTRIAQLRPGETVHISAAAGGVGTAAAQLARLMGAGRIIGSTGSPEKAAWLREQLGLDAVINYREGRLVEQLQNAAPEGIDVCIENVGGEQLEAAISAMRERGRIAWVGAIGQYHHLHEPPAAPRNLFDVVGKSLRLEGFLVRDYPALQPELEALVLPHLHAGRLRSLDTVVDGIEHMVDAFLQMLAGRNHGKMLVRV